MTRIPTEDRLAALVDEVRPILDRASALVQQCREWSDEGVKGIDTTKANVRGGSVTNPTEASALRGGRDEWDEMARRIACNAAFVKEGFRAIPRIGGGSLEVVWCWHGTADEARHPDVFSPDSLNALSEWVRCAEQLIADARHVDARWSEPTREQTARLVDENSTAGVCEWCGRCCQGRSTPGPDGSPIDDRRRRVVVSDRWSIGLCNACWQFLVRRWPPGQPMSDVARLDEIRKERDAHTAGRSTEVAS